jgi:hypothetical protein
LVDAHPGEESWEICALDIIALFVSEACDGEGAFHLLSGYQSESQDYAFMVQGGFEHVLAEFLALF